ncbi:hypothetical protein [Vibrio sp. VB16]|uniref:hypothetical protein n=1 Tax=Vibrio sp. VB16 TaxID=2785746 RepID=UPI00189E9AFB|nr:hypothetical protein [Vibrio sp. VB16]UGA57444.1 hypothetical protein IUZ65_018270 [Vibrio sp. VB16]
MRKILFLILLVSASNISANTLHISPEIKFGPYIGAGISGGGLQLGLSDSLGFDAIYFSYSDIYAEFLSIDEDQIQTYRLGGQYQLVNVPKMSLQLEVGAAKYKGNRKYVGGSTRALEGQGGSFSASWVIAVTDNIGFRAGADFNYIDKDKTFLPNSLTATISTGVVFSY